MTTDDARTSWPAEPSIPRLHRLQTLSGVAFVPLFLIGWFASGGITPDYTDSDQNWINWADDNRWNGRISGFAMLLALCARIQRERRAAGASPTWNTGHLITDQRRDS